MNKGVATNTAYGQDNFRHARGAYGAAQVPASFDDDAFDDADSFNPFAAENEASRGAADDTVELIAQPVEETVPLSKEAVVAAIREALGAQEAPKGRHAAAKPARGKAGVKFGAKTQARAARPKAAPAPASASASASAIPAEPEAADAEYSYEEPEPQARPTMALKAMFTPRPAPAGAHAAGGAHAAHASHAASTPASGAFANFFGTVGSKIAAAFATFGVMAKESAAEDKAAISAFVARCRARAEERRAAKQPPRRKTRRERRRATILGIASFVAALVAVWAAGVIYFTFHFMPHTTIVDTDVSGVAVEDAQAFFEERVASYTCSVAGRDYYILVPGTEINFSADVQTLLKRVITESNRWLWPLHLGTATTHDFAGLCTWDNDALDIFLSKYTRAHNAGVTPSEDAYVAYSADEGSFVVFPEVIGKAYVPTLVLAETAAGVSRMMPHVDLTDGCLQMPLLFATDQQLIDDAEECNSYLGADFDLILWLTDLWSQSGRVVDHIGNDVVAQWIHAENGEVYFDEEAMRAWCRYYADSHYTLEAKRTYTRPDGETVTQDGGTYGWDFDRDILCARMIEAILTGSSEAVVVPCNQSAFVWADVNVESDIGDTYVDVNIPTQVVRYIVDDEEVWRSPTISGDIFSGQGTPSGVWYVTRKLSPTNLRGLDPDGTPYDVPVQYWIAFIANSHGFHDNPNRNDLHYGPLWAFRNQGSHGCCNLPYPKAKALYAMIEVGCPVIVHW